MFCFKVMITYQQIFTERMMICRQKIEGEKGWKHG